MSKMNWFGETEKGIADSFGLQLFHFDRHSNAGDGKAVIAAEMDRAEAYIMARLPARVLRMLKRMNGERVISPGNVGETDFSTVLPMVTGSAWNRAYRDDGIGCGCSTGVLDTLTEVDFTYASNTSGVLVDALTDEDQSVYVRYDVDQSSIVLASLGSALRDYVCSILGHRLYVRGNEQWKLVDKYDAEAQRKLTEMSEEDWLPPELRQVVFIRPLNPTFTTIRINRG
jgi:hypothetical protein